jgi:hypothetical protein
MIDLLFVHLPFTIAIRPIPLLGIKNTDISSSVGAKGGD